MSEKFDLKAYLEERRKLVNRALEGYLPAVRGPAFRVVQAMHYSLFVGGKRLRPILCLAAAEAVGEPPPCPTCGTAMVMRNGRFGPFFACPQYPKCRGTSSMKLGVQCPEKGCEGQIVEKRSRKGKLFYGCDRYPDCRFALWDRPVSKPCPACDAPFLVERTRRYGRSLACIKEGCDYTESLES